MKKSILRIAVFLAILFMVLGYFSRVFNFKYVDGSSQMTTFYALERNTVDVLVLGSSHAFVNFNNGTLWDEHGIASFNLGGSDQPMWNTWFYMKEALKTQSPELIILDAYALALDMEYSPDNKIIKNTYGMKWSRERVDAVRTSTPPERLKDLLLSFGQYHNRYHSLNRSDFLWGERYLIDSGGRRYFRNWKGQCLFDASVPQTFTDMSGVEERTDLAEKAETYYRKILELAEARGIPVLVTVVPYVLSERDQQRFNRAADIAREYGVTFLDCNPLAGEMGLDFSVDYIDVSHMNCVGSQKFSRFIGEYIKENYTVSDRRGDGRYASWEENAAYTARYADDTRLFRVTDIAELGQALTDEDHWIFVSADGSWDTGEPRLRGLLDALGIAPGEQGLWMRTRDGIVWRSGDGEAEQYIKSAQHDFCLRREGGENRILADQAAKKAVDRGLNIIVYDEQLDTVIDCIGISAEDWSVTHKPEIGFF